MEVKRFSPFSFVILLFPQFNHASAAAFVEPFRVANESSGQQVFSWCVASIDGGWITASDGMQVMTQALAELTATPDLVMLSCRGKPESRTPALSTALRAWARQGVTLGALDGAAYLLAAEGLLDGKRATAYFEHLVYLGELFPAVHFCSDIMVLDGKRLTCCGGTAVTDCALHLIALQQGEALMRDTARTLFHERVREPSTAQTVSAVHVASGVPEAVRQAVEMMEKNLEEAISIQEICQHVGISQRQLNRLFNQTLATSPAAYYRDARLDRARALVLQTDRSLLDIAVASGFANQSHFSRLYRQRFALTPRTDRFNARRTFDAGVSPHGMIGRIHHRSKE